MAEWSSNARQVFEALEEGSRLGVTAMLSVVANEVKRKLAGGYTSGDFVTGLVSSSVTWSDPKMIAGVMTGYVGTNLLYALYWEMGHHNTFTRKFERVEIWVPALLSTGPEQQRVFFAQMESVLGTIPNLITKGK